MKRQRIDEVIIKVILRGTKCLYNIMEIHPLVVDILVQSKAMD